MRSYHPRHIHHHFLRNLHIPGAMSGVFCVAIFLMTGTFVFAAKNVNFHMVINPGALAINVVDEDFAPISTPTFDMNQKYQSTECQSTDGTLGTATQQIYIRNPDAAHGGWSATLSALSPQTLWQGSGHALDFNDSANNGCSDGPDADSSAGRMRVDFSESHIHLGQCLYSCSGNNIMIGTSQYFVEGTADVITLLSASTDSSDMGDWVLQGTKIIQTIPANQAPSENYTLDLYLSIVAS